MHSVYYKSLGEDRQVYDTALKCLRSRGRSFPVPSSVDFKNLMTALLEEHPELFYVGQAMGQMMIMFRTEAIPTYVYAPEETAVLLSRIEAESQRIIDENINDHQSDYDKVRALHDYLKTNLQYDYDSLNCRDFKDPCFVEAHSIVGAFLKKKCVCEGFAEAFKFLCDKIGLECWVVSGTLSTSVASGPHAWNIVKINGYYHHVDVTSDNQYSDSSIMPNYGYMNLSDEEISRTHTWNRNIYPACPDSPYNYFRVNNAVVDSKAQLESLFYNSIQMEEELIMFRVVRGSSLEREINGCVMEILRKASDRCKYISVASAKFGGVAEQLTFFVKVVYRYK